VKNVRTKERKEAEEAVRSKKEIIRGGKNEVLSLSVTPP